MAEAGKLSFNAGLLRDMESLFMQSDVIVLAAFEASANFRAGKKP